MTIYDLKPKFQDLLRPFVNLLAQKKVTANQVTWLALILSVTCGLAIYLSAGAVWSLLLLPLLLFVRMALNAVDGMLAREHNMQTKQGAMLNEMSDVISDAALYLPFAVMPLVSPTLIVLFVVFAVCNEMAGVVGQAINNNRRYDGPLGKSDRAFVMGLLALLLAFDFLSASDVSGYLMVVVLLSVVTLYKRMVNGIKG